MIKTISCLALCALFLAPQTFGQRLHDRAWGKYFGAYACQVSGAQTENNCGSLHLWHVSYGYYGSTIIAGKNVAVAVTPGSSTAMGSWRGTLYIDKTAEENQVKALEALFRRELAEYFGQDGLQVKVESIQFVVDQGVYYLRIGKDARHRIANADVAANAFAWWSTPRADAAPLDLKMLDRMSPIRTGEAPDVERPDLHVGHAAANWHKGDSGNWDQAGGTAILSAFEYRGEAYLDRGK